MQPPELELLVVMQAMVTERGKLKLKLHQRQRPRLSLKLMLMLPTDPMVIPADPGARQELRGSASRGQCRTPGRCQGSIAGRWQLPTMEATLMVDMVDLGDLEVIAVLVDTGASEVMDMGDTELFY